jgi:hypothetical protein
MIRDLIADELQFNFNQKPKFSTRYKRQAGRNQPPVPNAGERITPDHASLTKTTQAANTDNRSGRKTGLLDSVRTVRAPAESCTSTPRNNVLAQLLMHYRHC